jgi:hypothetical protein
MRRKSATPTPGRLDRLTHLGESGLFEIASLCQAGAWKLCRPPQSSAPWSALRSLNARRNRLSGPGVTISEARSMATIVTTGDLAIRPGLDRGSPGSPFVVNPVHVA